MPSEFVTVVLPAQDAARTLPLQLEALARQVDPPPFEILVADNRSTDGTVELLEQWAHRLPQLRSVAAHDGRGAGYARNVAVAHAHGRWLLCCDADDVVGPGWVAAGAAALGEVPVTCGNDVTLPDADFTDLDAVWARVSAGASDAPIERRTEPAPYPILLGGNLAIHRDLFERLGGYDESMLLANEDNDLAVRLQGAGQLVHRTPAMRIAMRQRASLAATFQRARLAGRGHLQLCDRHGLRAVSPHLRGNGWRFDAPRAVLAAGKQLTTPRERRDWPAVVTRLGAGIGLWEQDIRHHLPGGGR